MREEKTVATEPTRIGKVTITKTEINPRDGGVDARRMEVSFDSPNMTAIIWIRHTQSTPDTLDSIRSDINRLGMVLMDSILAPEG
jgi:hypothetical protein